MHTLHHNSFLKCMHDNGFHQQLHGLCQSPNSMCSTLQGEDEEDESNELVSQVLDEIGVNLDSELVKAPGQKQATTQAVAAEPEAIGTSAAVGGDGIDDDLQARLNNLRKQ